MGFRTLRDEDIHLNSTPFEGYAKKSASGTEIEYDLSLIIHYLKIFLLLKPVNGARHN